MKRLIVFILLLLLTGCGKDKFVTCSLDINNKSENYTLSGEYKIYYDGNYVKNIEKKEKIKSSSKEVMNYFYESKNLEYNNLSDLYKGYEYEITNNKSSINLNVKIDMNLLDIEKMVEDKKMDEDYVIANKLTKTGLIRYYESKGAKCDI